MEDKAIRGIRWTLLGFGASRFGSLLTTFVLARLLVPADFGVFAFASLFVSGILLFGTGGISSAIIVRQELGRDELRTALTLMLGIHALAAALIALASGLAGRLLGEPRASEVLLGLAVPVVFGGLTWFYGALLRRELEFTRQLLCVMLQVGVASAVSIALAAGGAGVWSLVAGQIAGSVAFTVFAVALAPYRVRPGFDRATAGSLLRTGSGFVLQGGASFVEQNADYAVIGSTLGPRPLGLYSMAYRIGELPYNFVVEPIAQATFPGFARMRERSEEVGGTFLATLRLTALCAFPLGLIIAAAADPLVAVLLGARWDAAVPVLQLLGVWGSLRVVQGTIGWFVNSMGHSARIGRAYALMLVPSLPLVVLAVHLAGVEAVACVMIGNVVAMTLIVGTIADRRIGVPARRQWEAVRPALIAAVPAWLATTAAVAALADAPALPALAGSVAAGAAGYLVTIRLVEPKLLAEARTTVRRVLAAAPARG